MKNLFGLLVLIAMNFTYANERNKSTQLDDLIRGEMSAVKAYRQVLEKAQDKNEINELISIMADHENAVSKLKKYASSSVLEDTQTVGPVWSFCRNIHRGSKNFR